MCIDTNRQLVDEVLKVLNCNNVDPLYMFRYTSVINPTMHNLKYTKITNTPICRYLRTLFFKTKY